MIVQSAISSHSEVIAHSIAPSDMQATYGPVHLYVRVEFQMREALTDLSEGCSRYNFSWMSEKVEGVGEGYGKVG
jgi:hypothetical protein